MSYKLSLTKKRLQQKSTSSPTIPHHPHVNEENGQQQQSTTTNGNETPLRSSVFSFLSNNKSIMTTTDSSSSKEQLLLSQLKSETQLSYNEIKKDLKCHSSHTTSSPATSNNNNHHTNQSIKAIDLPRTNSNDDEKMNLENNEIIPFTQPQFSSDIDDSNLENEDFFTTNQETTIQKEQISCNQKTILPFHSQVFNESVISSVSQQTSEYRNTENDDVWNDDKHHSTQINLYSQINDTKTANNHDGTNDCLIGTENNGNDELNNNNNSNHMMNYLLTQAPRDDDYYNDDTENDCLDVNQAKSLVSNNNIYNIPSNQIVRNESTELSPLKQNNNSNNVWNKTQSNINKGDSNSRSQHDILNATQMPAKTDKENVSNSISENVINTTQQQATNGTPNVKMNNDESQTGGRRSADSNISDVDSGKLEPFSTYQKTQETTNTLRPSQVNNDVSKKTKIQTSNNDSNGSCSNGQKLLHNQNDTCGQNEDDKSQVVKEITHTDNDNIDYQQPNVQNNGPSEQHISTPVESNDIGDTDEIDQGNDMCKKESMYANMSTDNCSESESDGDYDSSSLSSQDSISYMEKCKRKQLKNRQFLESRGFFSLLKDIKKTGDDQKNKRKGEVQNEGQESKKTLKRKRRGMIFQTKFNSNAADIPYVSFNNMEMDSNSRSSIGTPLEELKAEFPFRSSQIRILHSLLMSTVRQTQRCSRLKVNTREECTSNHVFVPSPIFITGSSGTGKTVVVKHVVDMIKRQQAKSTTFKRSKIPVTIADAYVDCGIIESSSLKNLMKNIHKQIKSDFIRRKINLNDAKDEPHIVHYSNHGKGTKEMDERRKSRNKNGDDYIGQGNNPRCTSNNLPSRFLKDQIDLKNDKTSEDHDLLDYDLANDDDDSANEDTIELQRRSHRKLERLNKHKNDEMKSTTKNLDDDNDDTDPLSFSNAHRTDFSSLGRALSKWCGNQTGRNDGHDSKGCAVLILDHAEKLFTLNNPNSNSWNSDSNNLLTQFMLLPKVMKLNLTIIIISSRTLLGFSRKYLLTTPDNKPSCKYFYILLIICGAQY